jgi:hypothetical protein
MGGYTGLVVIGAEDKPCAGYPRLTGFAAKA